MKQFIKEVKSYVRYSRAYYGRTCAYVSCTNRGTRVELDYNGSKYPDLAFVCKDCKKGNN